MQIKAAFSLGTLCYWMLSNVASNLEGIL